MTGSNTESGVHTEKERHKLKENVCANSHLTVLHNDEVKLQIK